MLRLLAVPDVYASKEKRGKSEDKNRNSAQKIHKSLFLYKQPDSVRYSISQLATSSSTAGIRRPEPMFDFLHIAAVTWPPVTAEN